MNAGLIFRGFHLGCLNLFAPQSVVAQAMRFANDSPSLLSLWPHNTHRPQGKKILKRRFNFAGCDIEMPSRISWIVKDASDDWHREFYSFRWMAEVASSSNQKLAGSFIREFISGFISDPAPRHDVAWEKDVVGQRLAYFMQYRSFILRGSTKAFRKRLGKSLIQHAKILYSTMQNKPESCGITSVWGLISASSQIADMNYMLPVAMEHFERLLSYDILPDNCHSSANPSQHLRYLQVLIDIRELLPKNLPIFTELSVIIQNIGNMLRFLCHGDGRLALFNSSLLEDTTFIARVIELSGSTEELPIEARNAGFCRLERQKTICIIKSRGSAEGEYQQKYRGSLSLEFSDENERFVVNCGGYLGLEAMWHDAISRPAAHSTLSFVPKDGSSKPKDIDNSSSDNSPSRELPAPNILSGQDNEGIFVECASNLFHDEYNIRHRRYVRLSKQGNTLSGRDTILNDDKNYSRVDADGYIRFHLHPDIRCKRDQDGSIYLTSVSDKTWIFAVENPHEAKIEESVFLGYYGKPQKTQQIVVCPALRSDKVTIAWSFRRKLFI